MYYHNSQNVCRNNRLDMFLNKCNILSPSQVGFRASMSTNEPLLDLVEEITTTLENNKYTVGFLLTQSRPLILLIMISKKLHLRGVAQSYLENRMQFVSFNKCHSGILNVLCGVPQDFIFEPKLFIMYINNICKVSQVFKGNNNTKCLNSYYISIQCNVKHLMSVLSNVLST